MSVSYFDDMQAALDVLWNKSLRSQVKIEVEAR